MLNSPAPVNWGLTRRNACIASAVLGFTLLFVLKASQSNDTGILRGSATRHESLQVVHSPLVTVMGSDALNKAYNLFRGKGASASVANQIVSFTVAQQNTVDWGDTVYLQPDQVEITMNARCNSHLASDSAFGLYSSSQADSLAKEESAGMAVSVSGKFGPAKGGLDASAAFGNKKSMKSARNAMTENFGSMSRAYVQATLYDTAIDWDDTTIAVKPVFRDYITSLNSDAKQVVADGCEAMGNPCCQLHQCACCITVPACCPTTTSAPVSVTTTSAPPDPKRVLLKSLQFFERFGTHVIRRGAYGAKCSLSTFMSKHASRQEVSNELQQQKNSQFAVKAMGEYNGVFSSGSASLSGNGQTSSQTGNSGASTFDTKTETTVSDVICTGYVEDNLCNQRFDAKDDNPAMVSYELTPIWDVKVAFKDYPDAARHLEQTYNKIVGLLEVCKTTNNVGCFFDEAFWGKIRDWGSDPIPALWDDEIRSHLLKLANDLPEYAHSSHYTWVPQPFHSVKPCMTTCREQGKVQAIFDHMIVCAMVSTDKTISYVGAMATEHFKRARWHECNPQDFSLVSAASSGTQFCLCLDEGVSLVNESSSGYPCSWQCGQAHDEAVVFNGHTELCSPGITTATVLTASGISPVINTQASNTGPGDHYRCKKADNTQVQDFHCVCVA